MSATPVRLLAEKLACRRGERLLFRDLSLALEPGEILLVAGPNGAGKSSLLRILAGFLAPESGRVRLEGAGETPLAEQCHYLGHRDGLRAALTVSENLAFLGALLGGTGQMAPALEQVGLGARGDSPVATLSAGQRRRVAFARLLMTPRPLWLLDEPTSALDAAAQEMVAACLAAHSAGGGIAVVASHLPLGVPVRRLNLGGQP